jgi:hypothetical protein
MWCAHIPVNRQALNGGRMLIHKLDENLWCIHRAGKRMSACRYDSREAAWRALTLSEEEQCSLQIAANSRASGVGAITLQEVQTTISGRTDPVDDLNRLIATRSADVNL